MPPRKEIPVVPSWVPVGRAEPHERPTRCHSPPVGVGGARGVKGNRSKSPGGKQLRSKPSTPTLGFLSPCLVVY